MGVRNTGDIFSDKLSAGLPFPSKPSEELWNCNFFRFSAEKKIWGQFLFTAKPPPKKGKKTLLASIHIERFKPLIELL